MTEYVVETLPWISPLAAIAQIAKNEKYFVLLHSGQQYGNAGRYSYLAMHPIDIISGNAFSVLDRLTENLPLFDNAWFGYLGYELLHDIENITYERESHISLPPLWFAKFGLILVFDHQNKTVMSYRKQEIKLPVWRHASISGEVPVVESLSSPMSRDAYLAAVEKTIEAIRRGDFYQANITRKFTGIFASAPEPFAIFCKLCETSPSAYSAFIRMDNSAIISSSPECFLRIDSKGNMESRPIKGTAPRFADSRKDEASRASLERSEKDKAENMMIVDLMRNDFARSCVAGSVKVEKLFEVSSYATVHHMISTITGKKREDVSTLKTVKNCFPPGSMTGAPKVRAMQWCMDKEKIQRGVYSGALGWFGGDGSCDLSVVIRTLVIQGRCFEFQVGGGIVADSDPEKERQETITKARGIMAALGLDLQRLEKL